MKPVTDLRITINASTENQIQFDPDIKSYDVNVPTDCFAALLRISYAPEFYISIRADRDAGRFGYADLDPNMGDYIAGAEIPYYEYYSGYIIRLDGHHRRGKHRTRDRSLRDPHSQGFRERDPFPVPGRILL